MTGDRGATVGLVTLLACAGCATTGRTLQEVFPPGAVASPWILENEVWTGTFEQAAEAFGEEADQWREFNPTSVWLAVYRHESDPQRWMKVRCLAFESSEAARRAFERFRPLESQPLDYGELGCWTELGVMFQWGGLVFDIFGQEASWSNQVQSTLIAALIAKRMPPGLPESPR